MQGRFTAKAILEPTFEPDVVLADLRKSVRRKSAYDALTQDKLRYQGKGLPIGSLFQLGRMFKDKPNLDPSYLCKITVPFLISQGDADLSNPDLGPKLVYAYSSTPNHAKHLQIFQGGSHNLFADTARIPDMRDAWTVFLGRALDNKFAEETRQLEDAQASEQPRWGDTITHVDTTGLVDKTFEDAQWMTGLGGT